MKSYVSVRNGKVPTRVPSEGSLDETNVIGCTLMSSCYADAVQFVIASDQSR